MTAQFAGSRTLDDRRRRRLAQESEVDGNPRPAKKTRTSSKGDVDSAPLATSSVKSDVVSEESLIPQALWKVLLYGGLGVAFWSFLVWLNLNFELGRDWEKVFSPVYGRAFQLFGVASLLITSQLCFTIWWYRSRSRKDFGGRYRIWGWAGFFWSASCLFAGLGLHKPLAKFAYQAWPIHTWRPETLYWFTPFAIGVLATHQLISQDMRQSRVSRVLWNVSLFCGCLAAGNLFGLDQIIPVGVREVCLEGVVSMWRFMLSFTLLYHARFVVHVTNEAAPAQEFWIAKFKRKVQVRCKILFAAVLRVVPSRSSQSQEKRDAKALLRKQKREARVAAKGEEKQRKVQARQDNILAKKRVQKEKEEAKIALQAKRAAEKEERKTKREVAAEKASLKAKQTVGGKGSSGSSSQGEPSTEKAVVNAEPRTSTGKKRKRVLGNGQRMDAAHEAGAPHVAKVPNRPKATGKEAVGDYDEGYDDDQEFQQMSRKQRRKARKSKRRSS